MRILAATVGIGGIVCVMVSGCGAFDGPPAVAGADLQKDISDKLIRAGQAPTSVTCKDDLDGEVGKTVRCDVTLSPTNTFQVVATVSGLKDNVASYDLAPALSKEQLEKSVSGLIANATVSCESGLEGKVAAVAHCDVEEGGQKIQRIVEVTRVNGLAIAIGLIPALTKAEVEASLLHQIAHQIGQRPDSADCTGNLEGKTGNTVDCTVMAGSDSQTFTLRVTTVDGNNINYSYSPEQ